MAVTNPIYDIDMNGLEELFLGVVAYVEVRSGFEDISNEIAREMRQMGAVVSDKRDHKVTHVIFREGTLRTSDWAKKHNVPLVGVGWLAASARNKMKFLCTPWREEYLKEQLDACGFRKKMKYKKYCKAMNVEEFEAEMHKSAEKIKKKLNQSLNKSKSITKADNSEYERLMKLTDPCLRPRPPTPEFVKKHIRRHERIRQGGRFSWESSDEEKDEEKNDIKYLTNEDCNENKENKKSNTCNTSFIEPVLNSPTPQSLVLHSPKITSHNVSEKDSNSVKKSILKKSISRKSSTIKELLPKVVQMGIPNTNQNKKKRQSNDTDVPSPKIQKILSTDNESLINKEIIPITQCNKMTTVINQFPWNKIATNNIPLSPLVTNIASMNYPASSFSTPKSKKKSLRTKLLKNSAKRRYQESECSSNENDLKLVLVPDTVQVTTKPRPYMSSSPDICTIPETPLIFQSDNSFTISDLVNSSQTSVIIQSQKDDFASNTSKTGPSLLLTKKNVRRSTRLSNCDSVIEYVNKSDLSESKPEKTDNYQNSAKGKKQNVKKPTKLNELVEGIDEIFTFKDNVEKNKSNIRRSNRISKQFITSQDATENVEIESKPQAQQVIVPQRNLKRHWSVMAKEDKKEAAEKKSKEKLNEIVEKPVHKFKKFRDSTDDFIFNSSKKTDRGIISKSLMYPVCNEIVFVGFDPDDCQSLKATCKKMPREYTCVDVIRTKEQLIVVSEKPRKSLELIKAFILGNTFVTIKWFQECVTAKKWLSWSSFIITYSDITKVPLIDTTSQTSIEHLFKDYTPMYISTNKQSQLPKYKLRLIIQHCGGIVTDSFRQAGLVIDTRKVNALSVTSSWILDCVKEGLILDHKKYQIA